MKRYFILGLTAFTILGCVTGSENIKTEEIIKKEDNQTKKVLVIDLDKEITKDNSKGDLRGDKNRVIPIFLGDNDEVSLKGNLLKRVNRIKIGDNDEVAFSGDSYTIKTSELKEGDEIIIKYKKGKNILIRVNSTL